MILEFLLVLAAPLAQGDGPGPAARATVESPSWLVGLESRWRAERSRARRRLAHLPPRTLLELFDARIGVAGARERAAFVEAAGSRLTSEEADEAERRAWRERLAALASREVSPLVRDRLLEVAASDEGLYEALRAGGGRGNPDGVFATRLADARIAVLLIDTLHEGHIPGFFDGQFRAIFDADGRAALRLARLAWDPRVLYVVRAMAVMALHESGDERLEAFLRPLLLSPSFEYDWPNNLLQMDRIGEREVRTYVACRLSQYARFSMAKAGIDEPIREKIAYLEERVRSLTQRAGRFADSDLSRLFLSEAMETLFEVGYHYQQLDEYEAAEARYERILSEPAGLRVEKWAHYNLACIRSIQGRLDEALEHLRGALEAGFTDFSWARRDGDLAPLARDPRFHRLLAEFEFGQAAPEGARDGE